MTPQEALAQALCAIDWEAVTDTTEVTEPNDDGIRTFESEINTDEMASSILDALPEGWALVMYDSPLHRQHEAIKAIGVQQERERLQPLLDAAQALYDCAADDEVCIRHNTLAVIDAVAACGGSFLADPEDDRAPFSPLTSMDTVHRDRLAAAFGDDHD